MIPGLIAAGASILGGFLGKSSADKAAEAQERQNQQNIAMQREFAQHGIRWKVEDAKAAGIHPLYAMGASTPSFTPVSSNFAPDTSMANAVASAGQDIGRSINATRTQTERNTAFNTAVQKLSLEKLGLENDVLRADLLSKVARSRAPAVGPAFPGGPSFPGLPGQGDARITDENLKRTGQDFSQPWQETGSIADRGFVVSPTGGLIPVPSADAKERIEDSTPHEWAHFWRNNIVPAFQSVPSNPPYPAPAGKQWSYSLTNGWELVRSKFDRRFHFNSYEARPRNNPWK